MLAQCFKAFILREHQVGDVQIKEESMRRFGGEFVL